MDAHFQELQKATVAIRSITENGPVAVYIIGVYVLSAMTYILVVTGTRKQRKRHLDERRFNLNNMLFMLWFIMLVTLFAGGLSFCVWRRWLPPVPGRAYAAMFLGIFGTILGCGVETACWVNDKKVTRKATATLQGLKSRVWMFTAISAAVALAIVGIMTCRSS